MFHCQAGLSECASKFRVNLFEPDYVRYNPSNRSQAMHKTTWHHQKDYSKSNYWDMFRYFKNVPKQKVGAKTLPVPSKTPYFLITERYSTWKRKTKPGVAVYASEASKIFYCKCPPLGITQLPNQSYTVYTGYHQVSPATRSRRKVSILVDVDIRWFE